MRGQLYVTKANLLVRRASLLISLGKLLGLGGKKEILSEQSCLSLETDLNMLSPIPKWSFSITDMSPPAMEEQGWVCSKREDNLDAKGNHSTDEDSDIPTSAGMVVVTRPVCSDCQATAR